MKKYKNINEVKLFGKYEDPYKSRCVAGEISPNQYDCIENIEFGNSSTENELNFIWLGHSSVFINMSGENILIDPVFGKYASPIKGFGPKRFPGRVVEYTEIPQIDLVLITHNHYDHLDKETIKNIDFKVKKYIVPEGVKKYLKRMGIKAEKITEVVWWEELKHNDLKIVFIPTQHDSSRMMLDMNRTLWGSYLLIDKEYKVYHSGDGGYDNHFSEVNKKYGDIDLTFIECGQYNEKWHAIHMFPEESVKACMDLKSKMSIPIHWGTYPLSDHAWNEPVIRFARMAEEKGIRYKVLKINEGIVSSFL